VPPLIRTSAPVRVLRAPALTVSEPVTLVSAMPFTAELATRFVIVPLTEPLFRASACPVRVAVSVKLRSARVSAPKFVPEIEEPVPVLPKVKPRTVLLPFALFRITEWFAPELVILASVPLPLKDDGRATESAGGDAEAIDWIDAVASCPISCWPLSKVTGPV